MRGNETLKGIMMIKESDGAIKGQQVRHFLRLLEVCNQKLAKINTET